MKKALDVHKLNIYSIILILLNLSFLISGHFIDFEINNLEKTSLMTNIIFGLILIYLFYGAFKILPFLFKNSKESEVHLTQK